MVQFLADESGETSPDDIGLFSQGYPVVVHHVQSFFCEWRGRDAQDGTKVLWVLWTISRRNTLIIFFRSPRNAESVLEHSAISLYLGIMFHFELWCFFLDFLDSCSQIWNLCVLLDCSDFVFYLGFVFHLDSVVFFWSFLDCVVWIVRPLFWTVRTCVLLGPFWTLFSQLLTSSGFSKVFAVSFN